MLEITGVPPNVLHEPPAEAPHTSYPPVFRADSEYRRVWSYLCTHTPAANPDVQWNWVLRQFLAWAKRNSHNVWPDQLTRVDNNELQAFLMLRRRWITQYIDKLGILQDVKWLKSETTVVEDRLGFTVNSSLHCRDVDFLELRALFRAANWRPNTNLKVGYDMGYRDWWRWLKASERGITRVGFSAAGRERGIFWYTITVPGHPFTPPDQSTEQFVLEEIWKPVVRTLRFHTLRRISHF